MNIEQANIIASIVESLALEGMNKNDIRELIENHVNYVLDFMDDE